MKLKLESSEPWVTMYEMTVCCTFTVEATPQPRSQGFSLNEVGYTQEVAIIKKNLLSTSRVERFVVEQGIGKYVRVVLPGFQ